MRRAVEPLRCLRLAQREARAVSGRAGTLVALLAGPGARRDRRGARRLHPGRLVNVLELNLALDALAPGSAPSSVEDGTRAAAQ
jgi:hypothetical protein